MSVRTRLEGIFSNLYPSDEPDIDLDAEHEYAPADVEGKGGEGGEGGEGGGGAAEPPAEAAETGEGEGEGEAGESPAESPEPGPDEYEQRIVAVQEGVLFRREF